MQPWYVPVVCTRSFAINICVHIEPLIDLLLPLAPSRAHLRAFRCHGPKSRARHAMHDNNRCSVCNNTCSLCRCRGQSETVRQWAVPHPISHRPISPFPWCSRLGQKRYSHQIYCMCSRLSTLGIGTPESRTGRRGRLLLNSQKWGTRVSGIDHPMSYVGFNHRLMPEARDTVIPSNIHRSAGGDPFPSSHKGGQEGNNTSPFSVVD